MNIPGYILWNPDVVAFSLGPVEVRWYSLLWCIGLFAVYQLMHYLFKEQKLGEDKFEPMFLYCFLGILIGSRLGHCLFYEPGYYLSHPMEMILPMRKFPDGEWHFTGYEGLAQTTPEAVVCERRGQPVHGSHQSLGLARFRVKL